MYVYIYICIYIYMCVYIYVYIYIHIGNMKYQEPRFKTLKLKLGLGISQNLAIMMFTSHIDSIAVLFGSLSSNDTATHNSALTHSTQKHIFQYIPIHTYQTRTHRIYDMCCYNQILAWVFS